MAKFNYRDYMKNNPLLSETQGYDDELDDSLGMKHGKKKQDMKQRRADSENMEKAKSKRKYSGDKSMDESYDDVDEEMDTPKKKITVKEFKASIRERILSEMNEEEEEMTEADEIDIDVEDDIEIDDVSDKSEIEVDSELAGEDADISAILGLLTKAQSEAEALGDEKLLDQIGNTITYYTRAHVVK